MTSTSRPRRHVVVAAIALCAVAAACQPAPPSLGATAPPDRVILFPVVGPTTYSDSFGAPRSGGRSHQGQDLMAPKHTPVVAVVDGTVTRVRHDNTGLSGNMLVITDPEGWRYTYIHLNNDAPGTDDGSNRFELAFADGIREGQRVRAGELVGYVGDSGNAESTAPHLHFEMHAPGGALVNAFASLQAAKRAWLTPEQMAAAAPMGWLDQVTASGTTVRAVGWAFDRVVPDPVLVSVYVDGNPVKSQTASGSRPDLVPAFGVGERHGFDVTVTGVAAGRHRVCVVAHNAGRGGGSSRIGCRDLQV